MKYNLLLILFVLGAVLQLSAQGQDTLHNGNFAPPAIAPVVYAIRSESPISIDGKLDEPIWQRASATSNFFRMEPRQGGTYRYKTFVKTIYDNTYLYFGVFCQDSTGKKGMRIQDFRRDFLYGSNDVFFVSLDPQNLKRYCVAFQSTPLGTQRDLQIFDDNFKDSNWDALWKVKSNTTDSGYTLEFAIPFSSLRYDRPKGDSVSWGITFSRLVVHDYEQTVFPAIPQSFSPYRMAYAAQLKGLKLPPPSLNLRLQPYFLYHADKTAHSVKIGGEAKWAINPHAVLDATVNTDFAQADADIAVNNLTRFNIFFPERRQFFLENNGIFSGAGNNWIRPYFSRTIGLSNTQYNADAVPIDAGIRFTDRNTKYTVAGLYVHQRAGRQQGASNFGVLRYLKSYGLQSNIGIMLTHKLEEPNSSKGLAPHNNTTLTIDGIIRPGNTFSLDYLASVSRNNTGDSIGVAFKMLASHTSNNMSLFYDFNTVSEKYQPGMGYVYQTNVILNNPGGYFIWRPKGRLSKLIRRWDPGAFLNVYHSATGGKFQSATLDIFPVWIFFSNNMRLNLNIYPTWEQFYFNPLGFAVRPGKYFYTQWYPSVASDQSKKISGAIGYQFGRFYDGRKSQLNLSLRVAPSPHIAFTGSYENISIRGLGINHTDANLSIATVGARFALNPAIQASFFYQYNSFTGQGRWNVRGSWEIAPLSFLYIVFNDNTGIVSSNPALISKISYLKQL